MADSRIWAVLCFGDDRSHAGNVGYRDELGLSYKYDSDVANHRQISVGDVLLLFEGSNREKQLVGVGRIQRIEEGPGRKTRKRCPTCRRTSFKARKTLTPEFRCKDCGAEFDNPLIEEVSCTLYSAHYEGSFSRTARNIGSQLAGLCKRYSPQQSMRELYWDRARNLVSYDSGLLAILDSAS